MNIRCGIILHGEDGGNSVQRCDDDADLTDTSCEKQGPGRLSVGLAMPKHLQTIQNSEILLTIPSGAAV